MRRDVTSDDTRHSYDRALTNPNTFQHSDMTTNPNAIFYRRIRIWINQITLLINDTVRITRPYFDIIGDDAGPPDC